VEVDDVLVRGALRAAVRGLEGQRLLLRDALGPFAKSHLPSRIVSPLVRWPVDLVRGRVDQQRRLLRSVAVPAPQLVEQEEGAERVDVVVVARVDDRRRHRDLRARWRTTS
jgi:hypothetical protein